MFRNGLDIPTLSKLTANTDSQQLQFEHKEASEPSHETVSNKVQERKCWGAKESLLTLFEREILSVS